MKPRFDYICPICGKVLRLTKKQKEDYEKTGKTCSVRCGGQKNAKRMRENNPMKREEVVSKMSNTLKARYASGELEGLRDKLRIAGITNLIAYNKSDECRAKVKERMLNNNPMKNAETATKVGDTLRAGYASGELTPPWLGKEKPDAKKRMSSDKNPMKDPEIRKRTLKKAVATFHKNGQSKGQLIIREILDELGISYKQEYMVDGPTRSYFLDFYLPDYNCAIEYDGHSNHYTEKGVIHDRERDKYINDHFSIRTIRIHRDAVFRERPIVTFYIKTEVGI